MHILHAYKIYRPDMDGGIPTVISGLTQNTFEAFSHSVLSARAFGLGHEYILDGVPVKAVASLGTIFSMPLAPFYIPAFLWSLRKKDVVVHHAPFPFTDMAAFLGLPANVALVVYWHADILGYPRFKRLIAPILRSVLKRADKIIVSGQAMIDGSDLLLPHAEKCEIFPYGVDVDYWRALTADELATVTQMKQRQPRHVLAVGRLVNYKGFDVLIRALRDIDGHATIVGEGGQEKELRQLAADLGVDDRVHFAGRLSRREIKFLLHSANLLALPSLNDAEAFGIVQLEAMAAGLPIVNTQLRTTAPWVARHNREALTVQPNDPVALASAINAIMNQPELAKRLGTAASVRVTNEFTEEVYRARVDAVYKKAVEARKCSIGAPHKI